MRNLFWGLVISFIAAPAIAQKPADPAMLVGETAPELEMTTIPMPLTLPAGMDPGAPASLAFDRQGHLWVLHRGKQPFVEYDADGKFIRAFGEGLLERSHGFRIDPEGNLWATDVNGHIVIKVNTKGEVLMTLGEKG